MDATRFDALLRSLIIARSRRSLSQAVLGFILGSALAASSVNDAAAKKNCPPSKRVSEKGSGGESGEHERGHGEVDQASSVTGSAS